MLTESSQTTCARPDRPKLGERVVFQAPSDPTLKFRGRDWVAPPQYTPAGLPTNAAMNGALIPREDWRADPPPPVEPAVVIGYGDGTDLVVQTIAPRRVFATVKYRPEGVAYNPQAFPNGAWAWPAP